MRLPAGFARLRPDLGRRLRDARRGLRLKQEVAAEMAGVTRETLSRIEGGRTAPRSGTLDSLLAIYEIDWDEVAIRGGGGRDRARVFITGYRGEQLISFGEAIRAARARDGLGLRELAATCGMSVAQLSRIERGQVAGGSAFVDHAEDGELASKDRRIVLANEVLRSLIRPGG